MDTQPNLAAMEDALKAMETTEESKFPKLTIDDLGFNVEESDEEKVMILLDRINLLAERTQQDPKVVLADVRKGSSSEGRMPSGVVPLSPEADVKDRAKLPPEVKPEE
jgi:hypothetical protein